MIINSPYKSKKDKIPNYILNAKDKAKIPKIAKIINFNSIPTLPGCPAFVAATTLLHELKTDYLGDYFVLISSGVVCNSI